MMRLVLILLLFYAGNSLAADWFWRTESTLANNNNINQAERDVDSRSDSFLEAGVSVSRPLRTKFAGNLEINANLVTRQHSDLNGLNRIGAGFGIDYRHKLGLGNTQPWVGGYGQIQRLDFDDEFRDTWFVDIGFQIGKRFGEQWDISGALGAEKWNARANTNMGVNPSEVFDRNILYTHVDGSYTASDLVAVFANFGLRDGDINSTTTEPNSPRFGNNSWARDPVFGVGPRTYKLDGQVLELAVGVNIVTGRTGGLDIAVSRRKVNTDIGLTYYSSVVRADFVWDF